MANLENQQTKYSALISSIETGEIKIPQFQRKFVWSVKDSAELIDSIIKGYPIGILIYWRTNERLRAIRNLGNIKLPEPTEGEYVNYILDGQQRLTSLFASIKGLIITDEDGKKADYSQIYIDLKATSEDPIVITEIEGKQPDDLIKLRDLMTGGLQVLASYPETYHEKLDSYKNEIQSYTFPVINLKNAPIDIATEVFTRLNVGGKSLTLFEIMVAKTYDSSKSFDLAEKYNELKDELKLSQYDTIPAATVLQVVSILLEKDCTRKKILKLDRQRFIAIWDEAIDCIKSSVDFFRSYGIPVGRLLPYNAIIVPFSYFYYRHKKYPTGIMKKRLEDFFWRVSLGFRYSSGVETKLAQDCEKIDKILKGQQPKYEWAVTINEEFLENNGWFSTARAFIKAILCLYARHKPKKFDSNNEVIIDNSWLKIASSKNYHHFFPKSYMAKNYKDWDFHYINHIANITIVDDFLNKRVIRTKSPSEYMKTFNKHNDKLRLTMKSHLIDLDKDGIWDDDYEKFYTRRIKRITRELNKFIIPQDIASGEQLETYEDVEEEELENE